MPSGFTVGSSTRITLSRISRISTDSSVATRCASRNACCAVATSLACNPLSIHTTALPSRASARAASGLTPRTYASFLLMSR